MLHLFVEPVIDIRDVRQPNTDVGSVDNVEPGTNKVLDRTIKSFEINGSGFGLGDETRERNSDRFPWIRG